MNEQSPLVDLFDQLIHDAQGQMYEHINFNPSDLRISAPEFIIEAFQNEMSRLYNLGTPRSVGDDFLYRGLKFIPSYALEVAVWHVNYPLYQEEWMLRKISLDRPLTINHGHYQEYILKLVPLFKYYRLNLDTKEMN